MNLDEFHAKLNDAVSACGDEHCQSDRLVVCFLANTQFFIVAFLINLRYQFVVLFSKSGLKTPIGFMYCQ